MKSLNYPLRIAHVQLGAAETSPLPPETLFVYWANDVPVGKYFTGSVVDPLAAKAALREAWRTAEALEKLRAPEQPPPASVSVVICTRNRPKELARCLKSFATQTRTPDQVVVVDNASDDDSTRLVALAAGAEYVLEPRVGLDRARNAGARAARCDIVAYTDDDVVLDPHWLERLASGFTHAGIWAVTGLVLPAELDTEAQWQFEHEWGFGRGFRRRDFTPDLYDSLRSHGFPSWAIGAGASMAFRRSVFDVAGYFDERLDVGAAGCSGDSEMWNRIVHQGGTCRYEPSAVVYHYHRREIADLKRQIRAYMRGHVAALLVQYERTGEGGNLKHLLWTLPKYYATKLLSRLKRKKHSNSLVFAELAGYFGGLLFYWRTDRPTESVRTPRIHSPLPPLDDDPALPVVGVIIPAYNAAETLDATLRSVRDQTYTRLDIVVVDDGSTDDTAALAKRHAAEDDRIRVISQPNQGLAAARNRGIRESAADFIAPVDADDLCHPEKFDRQVREFLKAGDACGLVYGWSEIIDENDRILSPAAPFLHEGYVLPKLLSGNFIGNGSSPMMRRSLVMDCGGYDGTLRARGAQGCEDLQLYLQIAERADFCVVPLALTGYRVTRRSMSSDICQMIESHHLVVAPYAVRYPEYENEVRVGHVFLAIYYIQRALRAGRFGRAFKAFRIVFEYDAALCVKTPIGLMFKAIRPRLLLAPVFRRLGLIRSGLFLQTPKR
ncbi:MAG: glycosyltransferase [Rhodospirillaceae bacterium]